MTEKKEKRNPLPLKIILIGFVGGFIWSFVNYLAYVFHFTEIGPNFLILLFRFGDWKDHLIGQWIGLGVLSVVSIVIAFIYYGVGRNLIGVLPGMVFGMILWGLVHVLLPLVGANAMGVTEVERSTITTSICIYILYGVFIAYSISYANYSNKENM